MSEKRFLSIEDLSHMPTPQWAIEGLFEVNSLVMLYGPPASYKSFMALDWMMHIGTGRKWLGKNTTPGKVLYVLGEGKASLVKRIQAWMVHHKPTQEEVNRLDDHFRVSWDVPQLAVKSSVDNMLSQLDAEKYEPNVIVVDTFARSFVGLDENSQRDTGLWVENADRLRQLGYTVIFLHHTAKNTEFGLKYRGSTAIMGAMDSAIVLDKEKDNNSRVVLKVTKQKDHDEGGPMGFQRMKVGTFGSITGSADEGSMVLVPTPQIDPGFTVEGQKMEAAISDLLADPSFKTDAERVRELQKRFPDLTESAARNKVSRARKGQIYTIN